MDINELASRLAIVANAGGADARCSEEVHARYAEAAASKDPSASLAFFWWLADRVYTHKEIDSLVYEAFYTPEAAKKEQEVWDDGLHQFALLTRNTLWNGAAIRQVRCKSPSLQLRFIEACLDFSSHLAKARYEILLATYYPYTCFFEIVLEKGAHALICVKVREARHVFPVSDRYERKAHAPIDMGPDEALMRVEYSWTHEVHIVALCSQGSVRQVVDQQRAVLKRAYNISTAWGAPPPAVPANPDKRPTSFWQGVSKKQKVGIPLMTFSVTVEYEAETNLMKRTEIVLREAAKGKEGDYDHGMAVLQQVLCTDDFCRQLVGVVEDTSGVDLQLSPQEEGVLSLPNNVIIIGRSGTGKTTCAVLRLWAKYQQLAKLRAGGDPDISPDGGLPFNGVFVTLSPVLSAQVRSFFSGLGGATELPGDGPADADTLRSSLRASGHEDLDDFEGSADVKGDSLLHFPEDAPVFCSLKELLFALDSTLAFPFFSHKDDATRVNSGWAGLSDAAADLCAHDVDHGEIPDDDFYDEELSSPDTANPLTGGRGRGEVTYEVFRNFFSASRTGIHPSLVWTEIFSHIKGSRESLNSKDGHLSQEAYLVTGRKQSPLKQAQKEQVYSIFLQYETMKRKNGYFDIPDVVNHIFRQIRARGYIGPPIHSVTIDEVQDFSASTLQLLMEVCKVPGGFFCTGDSAQTIARGAGFRFGDLRSIFYHRQITHRVYGDAFKVPDIHQLTTNYRSHRQLHNMAHSVVHLLECLFPEAIDKLAPDSGTRDGPKPSFLCGGEIGPIFHLLFGEHSGERQQFGAKQVIIVRDDSCKNTLPEELKPCLCLTVFEAKGLEFDDVILFNFFKDSSCTAWAEVGSVEPCPPPAGGAPLVQTSFEQLDVTAAATTGRHQTIDDMVSDRGMLCSELKHLYTAITRAKHRLVLVETSCTPSSTSVTDYWQKTELLASAEEAATSIKPAECTEQERMDQWRCQGLEMLRRSYFAQALKCFTYSKDEDLQIRCKAFMKASATSPSAAEQRVIFQEAADLFLQIDFKNRAAHCLSSAGKFSEAGELFEKVHRFQQAATAYSKATRWEDAARCAFTAGKSKDGRRFLERAGAWKELMETCMHLKESERIEIARRCTIKALWRAYPAGTEAQVPKRGKELLAVLASGANDGLATDRAQFLCETFGAQQRGLPLGQQALFLARMSAPCLAARLLLAASQRDTGAEQEVAVLAVQQISTAALKRLDFQQQEKHDLLVEIASLLPALGGARLLGLHGHWAAAGAALWNAGALDEARDLLFCSGEADLLAVLCGDDHPLLKAEVHVLNVLLEKHRRVDRSLLTGPAIPRAVSEVLGNDAVRSATAALSLQNSQVSRPTLLRLYAASSALILKLKPSSKALSNAKGMKACTGLVIARVRALLQASLGVRSVIPYASGHGPPPSSFELAGYLDACQAAGVAVPNHLFSIVGKKITSPGSLGPLSNGDFQGILNASVGSVKKCLNFLFNTLRAPLDELLSLGEFLIDIEAFGFRIAEDTTETTLSRILGIASRAQRPSPELKSALVSFCHRLFSSGRGLKYGFTIVKCLAAAKASLGEFYAHHFELLAKNEQLASQCKAYLALHCGDARAAWAHWLDCQERRELWRLSAGDLAEWRTIILYACTVLSGATDSPCDGCSVPRSISKAALESVTDIAREETMEFMQSLLDRHCALTTRVLDELESRSSSPATTWAFGAFVAVLIYNCGLPPRIETGIEEALTAWIDSDKAQPVDIEAFVGCCKPYEWAPEALEDALRDRRDPFTAGPISCTLTTTQAQSTMSLLWEAVRRGSPAADAVGSRSPPADSFRKTAFAAVSSATRTIQEERQSFAGQTGGADLSKMFQCIDILCAALDSTEPDSEDLAQIEDAVTLSEELVQARIPLETGPSLEDALRQKQAHQQEYATKQKNRQKQELIQERRKLAKKQERQRGKRGKR